MNELFREKKVDKTYWAVVKNKPPEDTGSLIHFLKKDEAKNKLKANRLRKERKKPQKIKNDENA